MGPAFTLDTGDKVGVTGNSHHSRDDSDEGGTRGTQGAPKGREAAEPQAPPGGPPRAAASTPTGPSHWYPPNQGRARRALPTVGTGESFGARLASTHWSFRATFSSSLQEKARELKDPATRRSKTAEGAPTEVRASRGPSAGPEKASLHGR